MNVGIQALNMGIVQGHICDMRSRWTQQDLMAGYGIWGKEERDGSRVLNCITG